MVYNIYVYTNISIDSFALALMSLHLSPHFLHEENISSSSHTATSVSGLHAGLNCKP